MSQRRPLVSRYGFNGYCFFVLTLVIRLWIVGSMEEEGLGAPMSQLDAGHVNKSDMLLPHVTH